MKDAVEMGKGTVIYIPSFVRIHPCIEKSMEVINRRTDIIKIA
jgi:hypothetical protein